MIFDVKCPELALLRFAVFDKDVGSKDDFIGQYTIPVASIQLGKSVVVFYALPPPPPLMD